jgi:hypothetical protein
LTALTRIPILNDELECSHTNLCHRADSSGRLSYER